MQPRAYLPRLAVEHYRDRAIALWTHTIEQRKTGWLTHDFHQAFRETMLHAAIREHLFCPIYSLMPDHFHLVWMGVSSGSDLIIATSFLRQQLARYLRPFRLQHQAHDSVLAESRRRRNAFARACRYVGENPVRARLVDTSADWPFTGCVVPGYPTLHPSDLVFWEKFWPIYNAATERGAIGKIGTSHSLVTSAATQTQQSQPP